MSSRLSLLLLLAGLLVPAQAQDQDVPVDTVAQGQYSNLSAPGKRVVRRAQELGPVAQALPAGITIDWTTHSLLVAQLGEQTSGGHEITVTKITRRTVPATPAPITRWTIEVAERHPSGPAISVITAPFHLVRVPRIGAGDQVEWTAAAPAAPFTRVRWQLRNQISSLEVAVSAAGAVEVQRRATPTAPTVLKTGQATAAELQSLGDAVRQARLEQLPADIPGPPNTPLGAKRVTLEVEGPTPASVSGWNDFLGQHEARVRLVDGVLGAIATRVEAGGPTNAFSTLKWTVSSGFGPFLHAIAIDKQDNVTIERRTPGSPGQTWTGQATQAERDRLHAAVAAADFLSLPDALPAPNPMPMDAPGGTFEFDLSGQQKRVRIPVAFSMGQYSARLSPVVDVLDEISQRVQQGPQPGVVEEWGTLRVDGGRVLLRTEAGETWRIADDAAARILRRFGGRTAQLRGRAQGAGSDRELADVQILQPERKQGWSALVTVDGSGRARIAFANPVPVSGPVARILRRADGRMARLDGWLFMSPLNRPLEVYAEAVEATVTRDSFLTLQGQQVGDVKRHDKVLVTGTSSLGTHAEVRTAAGVRGYLPFTRLRVGDLTVPLTTTPGLGGAVEGTGDPH